MDLVKLMRRTCDCLRADFLSGGLAGLASGLMVLGDQVSNEGSDNARLCDDKGK